jgi:membrane fusion protein, multidrug efflux system
MKPAYSSWLLCATVGAALLLAACGPDEQSPPEVRPVRSLVLGSSVAESLNTFTAEIRARYETDLAFQVGGKLVMRQVDTGALVRRGAVLARIDDQDLRTAHDAARAAVAAAEAQLGRARSDEGRFRDLLERGLTTHSSFLAQQTSTRTARSQLEQAQSELRLRTQQLSYATLRAERDGIITRTFQNPGAVVAAGQPVLALAQSGELDAVFDVAENQVEQIRGAPHVEIRGLAGKAVPMAATIREIAPSADPQTRTYRVRASLGAQTDGLNLGMIVTAAIRAEDTATAALAVPPTAVFQHGGKPALWIIGADSTVSLRPVEVQRYDTDRVLIGAGVHPGERVVTAGVNRLATGTQVRLLEQP